MCSKNFMRHYLQLHWPWLIWLKMCHVNTSIRLDEPYLITVIIRFWRDGSTLTELDDFLGAYSIISLITSFISYVNGTVWSFNQKWFNHNDRNSDAANYSDSYWFWRDKTFFYMSIFMNNQPSQMYKVRRFSLTIGSLFIYLSLNVFFLLNSIKRWMTHPTLIHQIRANQ